MKISNTFFSITIFSLLITAIQGCTKFVQIPPPITQLVSSTVFNDDGAATSALTSVYTLMNNQGESYSMSFYSGLLADELQSFSIDQNINQYYQNALVATTTQGPWDRAYNYIYQANAIIEGLKQYSGVSEPVKKQLTGEAKFIRTFWNFYLTNCYGDIPLVLTTDYTVNSTLARTPRSEVYRQIIQDLREVQNELSDHFVDISDTTTTDERTRPTSWVAKALLARIYLYTGKYDSAEMEATTVINNTSLFNLLPDLNQVFLANSQEAIWQLAVSTPASGINTQDGVGYIPLYTPSTALSTQLLAAFEAGDARRTNWINGFTDDSVTFYYYPFKYKVNYSDNITEYTMIFRLAEQYLIRSEARAQQGNQLVGPNSAASDLNAIRNRAGLRDYAGPADKDSLLSAILHERQVELFSEWGHRWFDMIRTNTANAIMGPPGNVCQQKGGTWSPNWQLYPIPQGDRNKDPNLTQNPGY